MGNSQVAYFLGHPVQLQGAEEQGLCVSFKSLTNSNPLIFVYTLVSKLVC